MKQSILLAGVATLAFSTHALPANAQLTTTAQSDNDDIIIVEGTRLEQTITEVGSSVAVITAEDLEELDFDFALDAVAAAPGVTINQNGAFGGAASVRIRGAASEQTLVLIDGVPINDPTAPGGGYDFASLDAANIERIEILKGPQSTLWGTDAIGGVVSITTKTPKDGLGASAFGDYGSYETYRGGAAITGANETGDFRLAITGLQTDGISKADEIYGNTEKDGYESLSYAAKGGVNLPNEARLGGSLLYTDSDIETDSFDATAPGSVSDGDEVTNSESLSGNVTLNFPLLDGRLTNDVLIGYADITRRSYSGGVESFSADGERYTYRYQGTLAINSTNRLAIGAEREEISDGTEDTTIDGLFALYEFKPVDTLTLSAGLRNDDHERFGSETTARAAAAWNPSELVTLRASWAEGFKAPTLFQTTYVCCGATQPNADLMPETSTGWDAGIDLRTSDGRGTASVTWFEQDLENLIAFSFADGGYSNIALAETNGIEIAGAYRLTDWVSLQANYAYTEAEDGTGAALIRVPEHAGDVRTVFDPTGPFSGTVLVRYNGEEEDSTGPVQSWTRVDLTGSYEVSDTVELYGRVENLFDRQYQQLLGYGTPGLSGSAGIRLTL